MFDQLMELVRQNSQDQVVQNPEVPNDQNDAVMKQAAASIQQEMQARMNSGGPAELKSFFEGAQSGSVENPAVQNVQNNFMDSLTSKFGLSSGVAKTLAASLIPMLMAKFFNKTKDPNESGFDIGSILSSLTGGGQAAPMGNGNATTTGGGFMDQASKMGAKLGLDKDGDGDTDLSDLMAMFK